MIDISKAQKIEGWIETDELQRIAEWASQRKGIIEIGSWKGRTTRAICDNHSGLVVTIDHWKGPIELSREGFWEVDKYGPDYVYEIFKKNLDDYLHDGNLEIYRMSSEEAAKELISIYGFGFFDMVWIDGGHEYEVVRKDLVYYRPLLRRYGQLCGHDYYYPGVKKSLDELFPQVWHLGNLWSIEV